MKNSTTDKRFANRNNGFRNTAMAEKLGKVRDDIHTKSRYSLNLRKTVDLGPDGTDHINIYKGCTTRLGSALSPFTVKPFTHPYFGRFNSREGLHYYLLSVEGSEIFRTLGPNIIRSFAQQKGIELNTKYPNISYFMAQALWVQIRDDEAVLNLIRDNQLPFDAYFTTQVNSDEGRLRTLIRPYGVALWSIEIANVISDAVKQGVEPNFEQFIENKAALDAIINRIKPVKKHKKVKPKSEKKAEASAQAETTDDTPKDNAVANAQPEIAAVDFTGAVGQDPTDLGVVLSEANKVFEQNGIAPVQEQVAEKEPAEQAQGNPEATSEADPK